MLAVPYWYMAGNIGNQYSQSVRRVFGESIHLLQQVPKLRRNCKSTRGRISNSFHYFGQVHLLETLGSVTR